MAFLIWRQRSSTNWRPTSYTADETFQLMNIAAGDLVGESLCRVRTAFDGGNANASASLGDGGDVDRFITTANSGITTAGLKLGTGGSGSVFTAIGRHLYTTADTIDVTFVADTAGNGSAGRVDWWLFVAKVEPH